MSATLAKFGALLMSATLPKFDALPATTVVVRETVVGRPVVMRLFANLQPHPTWESPSIALLALLMILFPRVCRGPLVAAFSTLEAPKVPIVTVKGKVFPQNPLTACAWKGRLAGCGDLLFLCACRNGPRVHALSLLRHQ
jgi:hypothetical protein